MELTERRISGETLFRGRIVNVREDRVLLPDGKEALREVIEHPGGVAVLALTDDLKVATVRQFRYPMGEILREIPAGKLEPGEDPADCGRRELREETGFVCSQYEPLGVTYPSPGCYGEKLHLFLARGLTACEACPDEDEWLSAELVPLEELVSDILQNKIRDGKTIIAVLLAKQKLGL